MYGFNILFYQNSSKLFLGHNPPKEWNKTEIAPYIITAYTAVYVIIHVT